MTDASLDAWIEDWNGIFDTPYSIEDIDGMVGRKVRLSRADSEETYEFLCVGHSKSVIRSENARADQLAIITDDGKMIQLRAGVKLKVIED